MNKCQIMINDYPHRSKPTGEAVKVIQANFRPCEMTLDELIDALTSGKTVRPAVMDGKTKNTFKQAEIVMIDIDNKCTGKLTVNKAVQMAAENGLKVWFAYYSFSNVADFPKFRLVFRLDKPITDCSQYEALKKSYASVFGDAADQQCSNADRLYFGTQNKVIPYRDDSAINVVSPAPAAAKKQSSRKHKVTKSKATGKFNTAHMQAIRDNRPERLHELLGKPAKRWFENNGEFYAYLYSINLIDFLGLPVELDQKFRCLKPGHTDLHPSARIFETENGNYMYFCDNCGKLNIKQLVEMLAGFTLHAETIRFLKTALNIEVTQTDSSRMLTENLDVWNDAINLIGDIDSFRNVCPVADKILREKGKNILTTILTYAKKTINPYCSYKDGLIFTMPLSCVTTNEREKKDFEKNLKTLITLHIIETVPKSQIPKRLLSSISSRQTTGRNYQMEPTFYKIPGWVYATQEIINDSADIWKSKKMTKSEMSFDYITAKLGEKEAKRIYPSYAVYTKDGKVTEKRTVSPYNQQLDDKITAVIADQVNNNGYVTMQKVIDLSGLSTKQVRNRIGVVTADMGLKSVFLTDALKAKYNADEPGRPKVYILD